MWKTFSRIKLYKLSIYKSVLITSPTGFDTALTNVETTLKQRREKVVSMLLQRRFNVGYRRCINVVQRWKSDVGFCFIFNVGSTLLQRWSQRWNNVDPTLKCWLGLPCLHLAVTNMEWHGFLSWQHLYY